MKSVFDTVGLREPILKTKFLFSVEFCGFPCFLDVGKGRRLPYVAYRMIGEINVSRDRFRCVFVVVFLYVRKETVA